MLVLSLVNFVNVEQLITSPKAAFVSKPNSSCNKLNSLARSAIPFDLAVAENAF